MTQRRAEIHMKGDRGSVEIDGVPLRGVHGFTLHGEVNHLPRLVVDLSLIEATVDGEMVVTIPEATRSGLIALGWIPPDAPEG